MSPHPPYMDPLVEALTRNFDTECKRIKRLAENEGMRGLPRGDITLLSENGCESLFFKTKLKTFKWATMDSFYLNVLGTSPLTTITHPKRKVIFTFIRDFKELKIYSDLTSAKNCDDEQSYGEDPLESVIIAAKEFGNLNG